MIKKISYFDNNFENLYTNSLKNTGFAVIKDFPFDYSNLDMFQLTWSSWFNLPFKIKIEYLYNKNNLRQVGYFPYKTEKAKGEEKIDLKEFFHIYKKEDFPPSIFTINSFCVLDSLHTAALKLLVPIQNDLKVNNSLTTTVNNSQNSLLRILHYPPVTESGIRAAAHEDINLITILPASNAKGLELLTKSGNWVPVITEKNEFIINVGDMLQSYSNGLYKSTTHRVSNAAATESRISTPFFVHPESSFDLGDLTAGEYLEERLKEINLK